MTVPPLLAARNAEEGGGEGRAKPRVLATIVWLEMEQGFDASPSLFSSKGWVSSRTHLVTAAYPRRGVGPHVMNIFCSEWTTDY